MINNQNIKMFIYFVFTTFYTIIIYKSLKKNLGQYSVWIFKNNYKNNIVIIVI